MSYYHAKKTAEAKRYLDDRDREVAIQIVDDRRQRSIAWLEKFRASGRASRTGFDWRPRWALQPPGDDNGKEIIEGEFAVMAHADAESEGRGQGGQAEGGGDAAEAGGGHAQGDARESESDFTEEDRTPF